jgi:hypothetical protein
MSKYIIFEITAPMYPKVSTQIYFDGYCRDRLFLLNDGRIVYGTYSGILENADSDYLGEGVEHNDLTEKARFDLLGWLVVSEYIEGVKSGKYVLVERDETKKTKGGRPYYKYIDKSRLVFSFSPLLSIKAE